MRPTPRSPLTSLFNVWVLGVMATWTCGLAFGQGGEVEPNNDRTQATAFALGTAIQGVHDTSDREDYFKVTLPQGGLVTFRLQHVPAAVDLNLYLYNAGGSGVGSSTTKGAGGSEVAASWQPAGDLFCRVYRASGTSPDPYLLTVSFSAAVDPHEPNDTFATATPLFPSAPLTDPWIYWAGDVDYYKINLPVDSALTVRFNNVHASTYYWAYAIYDQNQQRIAGDYWVHFDTFTAERTLWLTAGDYYLKTFCPNGYEFTTQPYEVSIETTPGHDPNEPNGTFATATPLTSGVPLTNPRIFPEGDVDYFRFDLTENSTVQIDVSQVPQDRYYRYILYNAAQQQLYDSGNFLTQSVGTFQLAPGTHYVRVAGNSGWQGYHISPYSIKIDTTANPDPHEPNDTFATATTASLDTRINDALLYLGGDIDFYAFTAPQAGTYNCFVFNVPNDLSVDLALYDSSQNLLTSVDQAYWQQGQQQVVSANLAAGDYVLRIGQDYAGSNVNWSTMPYTLLITQSAAPAVDHVVLTPGSPTVDPGDNVTFTALPVDAGGVGVPYPGNATWQVVPQTGDGTLATNVFNFNHFVRYARFTAGQSGTVQVQATIGGKTAQATVTIPPAADPHEPNNSTESAVPLQFGVAVTDALVFPNNDADYYEVRTNGAGRLTARLTSVAPSLNAVLGLRSLTGTDLGTVNTNGAGGEETLNVNLTAAGNYYLAVYSSSSGSHSSTPYHLIANFTPVNDAHEVNDTFASGGTPLTVGTPITDAFVFPTGDADYYVFTLPQPGDVTVTVSSVAPELNAAFNVADVNESWLLGSGVDEVGPGQTESRTFYRNAAGTYWVKVWGSANTNAVSPYTVLVTLNPLTTMDPYERNDDLANARPVASGTTLVDSLLAYSGDVDYFRTTLAADGTLSFLLSDLPADMDGTLVVYDSAGTQLVSVDRFYGGMPEFVSLNVTAGDYTVRVSANTWSRTPYKLGVNTAFGRFVGTVSRPGGSLLGGATVTATQGGVQKGQFFTGSDGAYELILAPGTYDLEAAVPGFASAVQANQTLVAAQDTQVDFALTDNQPPVIAHQPVQQAKIGRDLPVVAKITDNVGVTSATLFYRAAGGATFTQLSMTAGNDGETYTATIPAAHVTASDLEYYLEAQDAVSSVGLDPAGAPGAAVHFVDALQLGADFNDDGYVDYLDLFLFARQWHTGPASQGWDALYDLSPGADPAYNQPAEYIDFTDLTLFTQAWHTGTPPPTGRAAAGAADNLTVALDLDPEMPGIQNVASLQAGDELTVQVVVFGAGSLQGLHARVAFPRDAVELVRQGRAVATQGDWVQQAGGTPLFFANEREEGVEISTAVLGRAATLSGGGVLATLHLKVRNAATAGPVVLGLDQSAAADSEGVVRLPAHLCSAVLTPPDTRSPASRWSVQLIAQTAHAVDAFNFFGVADERDRSPLTDLVEPPWLEGGLSLGFLREGQTDKWAAEMRAPGTGPQVWEAELTANGPSEAVALSWPDLGSSLPRDLSAVLVDELSGRRVQMRTQTNYRFATGGQGGPEVRRFRVEVAPRAAIETPLLGPLTIAPNRGRGVRLTFQLSRPAAIGVEILNGAGRRLRQVNAGRAADAGLQSFVWEGVDEAGRLAPRGVYLIRVTARDDEGRAATAVRPAALR